MHTTSIHWVKRITATVGVQPTTVRLRLDQKSPLTDEKYTFEHDIYNLPSKEVARIVAALSPAPTGAHELIEDDAEFDSGARLTGRAVWSFDLETCFDADIGGSDGQEVVNVQLVSLTIGGLRMTGAQVALAVGQECIGVEAARVAEKATAEQAWAA